MGISGAGDGNRTRINGLEGRGNEPLYDTRSYESYCESTLVLFLKFFKHFLLFSFLRFNKCQN